MPRRGTVLMALRRRRGRKPADHHSRKQEHRGRLHSANSTGRAGTAQTTTKKAATQPADKGIRNQHRRARQRPPRRQSRRPHRPRQHQHPSRRQQQRSQVGCQITGEEDRTKRRKAAAVKVETAKPAVSCPELVATKAAPKPATAKVEAAKVKPSTARAEPSKKPARAKAEPAGAKTNGVAPAAVAKAEAAKPATAKPAKAAPAKTNSAAAPKSSEPNQVYPRRRRIAGLDYGISGLRPVPVCRRLGRHQVREGQHRGHATVDGRIDRVNVKTSRRLHDAARRAQHSPRRPGAAEGGPPARLQARGHPRLCPRQQARPHR